MLAEMSPRRQGGSLGPRRWWRLVTIERLPPNLRFDAIQTCLFRGWHPGDAVYRLWPDFGRFEVVRLSGRKRSWADYAAHRKTTPGPDMRTPPQHRPIARAGYPGPNLSRPRFPGPTFPNKFRVPHRR